MIWVFRTSVQDRDQAERVSPLLDELIMPGGKWNFDLDDCDRILRVESKGLVVDRLIARMKEAGFHCEELPD